MSKVDVKVVLLGQHDVGMYLLFFLWLLCCMCVRKGEFSFLFLFLFLSFS